MISSEEPEGVDGTVELGAESEPVEEVTERINLRRVAAGLARRRRREGRAVLRFRRGRELVEVELLRDTTVIGRDGTCEIVLRADGVSRRHAHLARTDQGYYEVVDLGSTNGTKAGGVRIQQMMLLDGDTFSIAGIEFEFGYGAQGDT